MLFFVLGAVFGEVPGEEKGDQNDDYPEAPEMVLPGVALYRLPAQSRDLIIRLAAPQVGFAGIGKVASRL